MPRTRTLVVVGVGVAAALATEASRRRSARDAPVVRIVEPRDDVPVVEGDAIALVATARDAAGADLGAAVEWRAGGTSLGRSARVVAPGLRAGRREVTARATDAAGRVGSARVRIDVHPREVVFEPVADAHVDGAAPEKTFGGARTLTGDGSPVREAFLRFAPRGIAGLVVESAVLRLTVAGANAAESDAGGSVHAVEDTGWRESRLAWRTRPRITGRPLATFGAVRAGDRVEADVTRAVTGDRPVVLALRSASADAVKYRSRESNRDRPALVLRLRSPTVADERPAVAIGVPRDGAVRAPGAVVTLGAVADDAEDGPLSARVAWTSDVVGPLGRGPSIKPALPMGRHVIRAAVTDRLGQIGEARISLVVDDPPAVTITSPPADATVPAGAAVTLAATAVDAQEGDLGPSTTWSSDRDGALGRGSPVVVHGLSRGPHTLTASVADRLGVRGGATVRVTVGAGTVVFPAAADTFVSAREPGTAFGSIDTLRADASPETLALVRFAVTGLGERAPERATVRLVVADDPRAASASGGALRSVRDTGWDEARLTWSGRPPADGAVHGAAGAVRPRQVVEFDVTSAIAGDGAYAFALTTDSGDAVRYLSRDAGAGGPRLVVDP